MAIDMATTTPTGYWGQPTATVDWCELNYQYSPYIAEFWNTLSNLLFVLLGLYGFVRSVRDGAEWRFRLTFLCEVVTGFGSAMFHGTLQLVHQQWDETPMIWGVLFWVYIMYDQDFVRHGIPDKFVVALFTIIGIGFATLHFMYQLTLTFQFFFGVLASLCLFRLVGHYASVKDPRARGVALSSMRTTVCGFGLWLLDYHYCSHMSALPINPQGHAWWHILMGVGTYYGPVFMQFVRAEQQQRKAEIVPTGFGLVSIVVHGPGSALYTEKKLL